MAIHRTLFYALLISVSQGIHGQSITVIGGNESARSCHQHALFSDQLDFLISPDMLESCNYALDYVQLNRQDKAATYTNRGILLYRSRKYEEAFKDFEDALSLMPEMAEIFVNRGNAYFMTGDFGMALEDYERAMQLEISDQSAVFFNMGMANEGLGNVLQAISNYENALTQRPNWPQAQRRLQNLQTPQ